MSQQLGPEEKTEGQTPYKALAREYIGDSFSAEGMRPLRRELRRGMKVLRAAYEKAVNSGKTALDEWLGDNYHLLGREAEALRSDLRYAVDQPSIDHRPSMYLLLRQLVQEQGTPSTEELGSLI